MQYFTPDGRQLSERDALDERGNLKDGIIARTRMTARDSDSRSRLCDGYGNDDPLALLRPGFRQLRSDDQLGDHHHLLRDGKRDAYREYQDRMSNAWRTPAKHAVVDQDEDEIPCPLCEGTGELDGGVECPDCHGEGSLNVATAMTHHARRQENERSDRRSIAQRMADHKANMDKAYQQYADEQGNAWRHGK
jgi:hypothetical protein